MSLVVFTGLCGLLAAPGHIHPVLGFTAVLCIADRPRAVRPRSTKWWEADLDAGMKRTAGRPLPQGRIKDRTSARDFGVGLSVAAVLLDGAGDRAGWRLAILAASESSIYAVIYTIWLKRSTPQNIVIGGGGRGVPPLIGWVAAGHDQRSSCCMLFPIIFYWTPPHFWALALLKQRDYDRAGVPMLPVVRREEPQTTAADPHLQPDPRSAWLRAGAPRSRRRSLHRCRRLPRRILRHVRLCRLHRAGRRRSRTRGKEFFAYSVLYLFLLFAALLVEHGFGLSHAPIPLPWSL